MDSSLVCCLGVGITPRKPSAADAVGGESQTRVRSVFERERHGKGERKRDREEKEKESQGRDTLLFGAPGTQAGSGSADTEVSMRPVLLSVGPRPARI